MEEELVEVLRNLFILLLDYNCCCVNHLRVGADEAGALRLFDWLLISDRRALLPRYRSVFINMFSAPLISDWRHVVVLLLIV